MGLLKSAVVVAALALAAPVWADGGHGNRHGNDHGWQQRHYAPAWRYQDHRRRDHYRPWRHAPPRHYYDNYYYQPYYYRPYPSYGYAAPAPGVHIVTPDIYIPWR